MKKASKVLTLILVVAILTSLFAGCASFGKNSVKYRQSTAIKVGDENISVGKVVDTFNSYYNNYAAYINAGYLTADSLMEMTMSSLYSQMEKVDAYKHMANVKTDATLKDFCYNAEYLTKDELNFVVTYVKYMVYSTIDSLVEDYIKENHELKDAEEDDTSRDFTELDGILENETYAEYVYRQNLVNKDMDKYIDKYYSGLISANDLDVDSYVYQNEAAAKNMLADLTARIDGDDKVEFKELQDSQNKALKQYKKNVVSTYQFDLTQLVKNQIEDVVASIIVAKYNLTVNGAIENGDISNTLKTLDNNHKQLVATDEAKFNTDGDFISFIENLSSGDFIHSVPTEYTYIFVKNILIPFSDSQKALLSNVAKQLGTTDSDQYRAKRMEVATKIVAEDFLSDKDSDGKHAPVKDVFTVKDGKLIINPECKALSNYLSDGSVTAMTDKTKDETIIELMKQFNTDTAQHTAAYDYVVRVGATPSNYTAKWVTEFVDAANEAKDLGEKSYALGISEYGVHIVYYVSDVAAQKFDFTNKDKLTDPTSNEYKLFKSYFETQSSLLLSDASTDLHKSYIKDGKISKTKNFDQFLKDNNIEFDFNKSLEDAD